MRALRKYYKKRLTTIISILSKPEREFTTGVYHRLRVEIKKLNAIFHLLNFSTGKFKRKKSYRPFKDIFRQAGKIRDLQLEENYLKKFPLNKFLANCKFQLRSERLIAQKKFYKLKNEADLTRNARKIDAKITGLNRKKIKLFLRSAEVRIHELLSANDYSPAALHLLRKQLKMYSYISKIDPVKSQKNNLGDTEELMNLLGKYHDRLVILKHFSRTAAKIKDRNHGNKTPEKLKAGLYRERKKLISHIKESITAIADELNNPDTSSMN